MSLDNTISTDRPTHTSERQTQRSGASAEHPAEQKKSDEVGLESDVRNDGGSDVSSTKGSMALGKQRSSEEVLATEPEKHLTPRATSKEFVFPKSN